ncbi:hypothetical protein C8Q79DRAFT_1003412 [Trametes meyenii]|nr:hypothetical protein C8Q79DRAFT_1003412 [Trametes meyenii]
MDVARARSPPASLGRRPIGPRSPGKSGFVPKNILPLDLSSRLQDEIVSAYSSPEPPASSQASSPAPIATDLDSPAVSPSEPPPAFRSSDDHHPEEGTVVEPWLDAASSTAQDSLPADASTEPALTYPPPEPESAPPTPRTEGSRPTSAQVSAHSKHSSWRSTGDSAAAVPSIPPSVRTSAHSLLPYENSLYNRRLSEKGVQANILPVDVPPGSTPASTRASTPALVRVVAKRPPLVPPPALNFEAEQIPWKGMTLEAAQWTFTSEQLQETVSRAIRHSASESFIRVVPIETFETELPQELERLDSLKATTQAQYRFSMHRRTMLLQSLAALSQSQYPDGGDGEALYNLTTQLADLTVSCDRLMETLVRISDQRAQIQHVQNLHIASALSMALRKLNASYAKRTAELEKTRAHNEELKAELEEAWSMAQDMAQEMDDLDNFDLAFSDEEDDHDADALEAEIYSDMDRMSTMASVNHAEVVEITGKAVATKAMLTTFPGGLKPGDRTSRVSAAKKRSSRASKASLRIPKTPTGERGERPDRSSIYSIRSRRRSRSKSMRRRSERSEAASPAGEEVPEVPIIRIPNPTPKKEGSFLELSETRPVSPAISAVSEPPPPVPEKPEQKIQDQFISSPTEDPTAETSVPNPPPSPTLDGVSVPVISIQQEPKASWRARKLFTRRVQSLQPSLRAADDVSVPPLKRSISEVKQFDGWPFLGGQRTQRFSVPVLSVIQPLKGRSSSESAPAGTSPRPSTSSGR